jgi:hypothetical protein
MNLAHNDQLNTVPLKAALVSNGHKDNRLQSAFQSNQLKGMAVLVFVSGSAFLAGLVNPYILSIHISYQSATNFIFT